MMNMDTLKSWVSKEKASGFAQNAALGVLALGVGIVICGRCIREGRFGLQFSFVGLLKLLF